VKEESKKSRRRKRGRRRSSFSQKLTKRRNHVLVSSSLSCQSRDSACLPKLCLNLNRSHLEKYLYSTLRILQKYFTDRREYFSRVTSILSYRLFLLVRLANTIAEIALRINTKFLYNESIILWKSKINVKESNKIKE